MDAMSKADELKQKILDDVQAYYQEMYAQDEKFVPGESRVNYGRKGF